MEIWLSSGNDDKLQLPINPEKIGYTDTSNFEDLTLASGDEATVISGRIQRTYEIVSVFMVNRPYYAAVSDMLSPKDYVEKIKGWMDNRKVLLFQVTGTNINEQVTIRSFNWSEIGGTAGDVEYTLDFKQYRPVVYSPLLDPIAQAAAVGAKSDRPADQTPQPTVYTVKDGDSLYLIAANVYGDGGRNQDIYNANKDVIGPNPNLIQPGQSLVIP